MAIVCHCCPTLCVLLPCTLSDLVPQMICSQFKWAVWFTFVELRAVRLDVFLAVIPFCLCFISQANSQPFSLSSLDLFLVFSWLIAQQMLYSDYNIMPPSSDPLSLQPPCLCAQVWTWRRGPGRWNSRWTSTSRAQVRTPGWSRTTTG